MKNILAILVVGLTTVVFADAEMDRAKLELVVEDAGEMLAEAERPGSPTHFPAYRYYFGLVYGCGTNLLSRADSQKTVNLQRNFMKLAEKDYETYTKIESALANAAATGPDSVRVGRRVVANGSRHRAKRIANAEKFSDAEVAKAIKVWEKFARELKK